MATTLVCPFCAARWRIVPTGPGAADGDYDLLAECPVCKQDRELGDGTGGVREPSPDPPQGPSSALAVAL